MLRVSIGLRLATDQEDFSSPSRSRLQAAEGATFALSYTP
jgi:hypothetical protein